MSNIIRVLTRHFIPINDTSLVIAYDWAVEQDCGIDDLLQEDIAEALITAIVTRL